MSETILHKETYQTNCRQIFWAALGMTIASTVATIHDLALIAKAESILMARQLERAGLIGTYFAHGNKGDEPAK